MTKAKKLPDFTAAPPAAGGAAALDEFVSSRTSPAPVRPPATPAAAPAEKMEQLNVMLSAALKRRFLAECQLRGKTAREVVPGLLQEWIDRAN